NTKIEILAEKDGWFQAKYNSKTGWVSGDYIDLLNLLEVKVSDLRVRKGPSTSTEVLGMVGNELLAGVLDSNDKIIRDKEWYKVYYNGTQAWVSGGQNGTEYIRAR